MKMDKLKKDDIQLEKVVSELKERLKYKDELNLNLIQRNRELKAKLRLQLSLKSELTEKELLLTVGLESLLLLKKHRNHLPARTVGEEPPLPRYSQMDGYPLHLPTAG